jgi:hypothetical protein
MPQSVKVYSAMEVSLHAPFRLIDRDLRVFARQGPNQALELIATRRAFTFQMIKTVLGFSVALPVAARQGNRLREIQKSKNTTFAKNESST